MTQVKIRQMQTEDWEAVSAIYLEGIQTKVATFQTEVPTWDIWDTGHIKVCRLVAVNETGSVMGWAALSGVSSRCVYGGVAELSVYVGEGFRGKGIGKVLLERIIEESEKEGYWTLQAGIFANNFGSINLHLSAGFRKVGIRERIAKTQSGIWQDTVLLERRSNKVGI